MVKGAVTFVFLAAFLIIGIIGISGFVSAGAVSCADLMASTGKSAETLCKVNYAGQCCNQDTEPDTASSGSGTDSGDNLYLQDCVNSPGIIEGLCELENQYQIESAKIIDRMGKLEDYDTADKMFYAVLQAQTDYSDNVFLPKDAELQRQFNACLDTETTNCYEVWEAAWGANHIVKANYNLNLMKEFYVALGGMPLSSETSSGTAGSGGTGSSGSAGSDTPGNGLWNENDNRGRDKYGRMMPSFGGSFGDAYVERADGTKVIPGKELYLQVDDSIKSGPGAKINIIFSQVGRVDLGENTQLKVGSALLDQFYLTKGTLRSTVKFATPDKFEIDTPNAKVFVRGTEYVVDYNETTGTTIVHLHEGVLEISAGSKNVTLTAGNYLIIYSNGTTQTGSLNTEDWNNLGNKFYEVSNKGIAYFVGAFILMELVAVALLRFWTDRKVKNPNKKDRSNIKGLVGLVLGILGLVLIFAPYFGIIASGIALSLARIQKANNPNKVASVGHVLGIIGVIFNAIFLIILGVVIMFFIK